MAMTKEEQRAAADRILAQEPMTAEELAHMDYLSRQPEDYMRPEAGMRTCGQCGEVFEESGEVSAQMQMAAHQTQHNPTSAHWTNAHLAIQSARNTNKG